MAQNFTAKIEDDELVIRAKLQQPKPSASGKTLVVASSYGNQQLEDVEVDGRTVTLGFNAYIKP